MHKQQSATETIAALLVLGTSFVSTYAAFIGWDATLAGVIDEQAVLRTLLLQGIATYLQWVWANRPWHPFFLIGILMDVIPTTHSTMPVLMPWLVLHAGSYTGGVGVWIVLLFGQCIYPERTLKGQ